MAKKELKGGRLFNVERFERLAVEDPVTGCLRWTGPKNNIGYGLFGYSLMNVPRGIRKGNMMSAHRAAWMIQYDQTIPPGINVNHTCHQRDCVNWAHLWLGTQQEKIDQMHDDGMFEARNRRLLGPYRHKQQNRVYKYTDAEMLWMRDATGPQIAERFGLDVDRAYSLRGRMRGLVWLGPWLGRPGPQGIRRQPK
jgi:hypothetical protein